MGGRAEGGRGEEGGGRELGRKCLAQFLKWQKKKKKGVNPQDRSRPGPVDTLRKIGSL